MKKAILIALAFLMTAGIYAQYRGTYWGELASELASDKHLGPGKNHDNYITEFEESARMMGEATQVRYFTQMSKLKYIGYTIDWTEDRESQLIKNLDTGMYKIESLKKIEPVISKAELEQLTPEEKKQLEEFKKEKLTYIWVDDIYIFNAASEGHSVLEEVLNEESNTESEATFIKAKYGSSTDIYVLSKYILDTITVIYTEAVQDF